MVDAMIRSAPDTIGAVVTPTYPLGRKPWRIARTFARRNEIGVTNETERIIDWSNGHQTQYRSAHDPGDIVGESWSSTTLDEAGRLAADALDYIEPMTTVHDATQWRLGTPRGKGTRFYSDYLRGLDADGNSPVISGKPPRDRRFLSFRAPSTLAPWWTDERIEHARSVMSPPLFRQEVLAEFLDAAASPFGDWPRVCTGRPERAPHPDGSYVAGCDLAKHQDFTRLRMFRVDGPLPRLVAHWSPSGDWTIQLRAIATICRNWGASVCMDATGIGDVAVDTVRGLGVHVYPYVFTAPSKATLIEHYARRIQCEEIELLPREDDPIAWQEHEDFIAEPIIHRGVAQSDVSFRYGHADGKHDDAVIANALGVWAAFNERAVLTDLPLEVL